MKGQFRKGFCQRSNKGLFFVQVVKINCKKVCLKTPIVKKDPNVANKPALTTKVSVKVKPSSK